MLAESVTTKSDTDPVVAAADSAAYPYPINKQRCRAAPFRQAALCIHYPVIKSRPRQSQTWNWASSIRLSIWSAGRLINCAEISVSRVSNRSRSSSSCRKLISDRSICRELIPAMARLSGGCPFEVLSRWAVPYRGGAGTVGDGKEYLRFRYQ